MSRGPFEERLRRILDERYHHRHPFNVRMHEGTLTPEEIRRWVRNRYYYQTRIPIKDGLILTKAEDPSFRRGWIRRIRDHDGDDDGKGGLALWLELAGAVGLDREDVASLRDVLPGVRRACDAYVDFVGSHDLLESVASSLTELYAGPLLGRRADAFARHYGWIAPEGLAYFQSRTTQAPRDAAEGLAFVLAHATSPEARDRCSRALERKCEILWSLLDGVEWGGRIPRIAAGARLRDDPAAAGGLAVLPERAVRLDAGARAILDACDGRRNVEAVAAELGRRHPGTPGLARDVYEFLEEMARLGVIELVDG